MRKGQKMPEELRKKQSERMKANPISYWKGKKRGSPTLEWKKKISEALKLAYKEGRRKVSKNDIERISNLNKGKIGKKHPKWTDNKKRPFYQVIRTLHEYKQWRTNIYEKDNYTCQICGKRGGNLEADHYPKMFIEIIRKNNLITIEQVIKCNELWLAKGRTLCKQCHLTTFRLSKK